MLQSVPPPVPPPPAVFHAAPSGGSSIPVIVSYAGSGVVCDDGPAPFLSEARPFASGATVYRSGAAPARDRAAPVTLAFRIDEAGRPMSIVRSSTPSTDATLYTDTSDLEPALAVSRFEARARSNCRITYTGTAVSLDAAPPLLLAEFASGPLAGSARRAARQRLVRGTCGDPGALQPRTITYPDLERLKPLVPSQSFVAMAHDIDATGRPIRLRMLATSGAAALDAELTRAIRASRFGAKALTGCLALVRVNQKEESPPPSRPVAPPPSAATCPFGAPGTKLTGAPQFPLAFRRRGVEGWAYIGYDVAPWGEFGNMKVIAAEPAEGFGAAAMSALRGNQRVASASGRSGCVQLFLYRLPPPDGPQGSSPIEADAFDEEVRTD